MMPAYFSYSTALLEEISFAAARSLRCTPIFEIIKCLQFLPELMVHREMWCLGMHSGLNYTVNYHQVVLNYATKFAVLSSVVDKLYRKN